MKSKTIAEYAFRKWMESEGLMEECFRLDLDGPREARLKDGNGDELRLVYNPANGSVFPVGTGGD